MKLKTLTALAALLGTAAAHAVEIVHYDNTPITINLQTGVERTIQLGDHVQVGVSPQQEMQRLFRVQSAQGAVHILPNKDFEAQRIQIRRMTDGQILLVDLVASAPAEGVQPLEDMRIYVQGEDELPRSEADVADVNVPAKMAPVTPITLTRYAAQRMYAPARLHKDDPRITTANLNDLQGKSVRALKGIAGVHADVTPVIAYRAGNLQLAALLVRNTAATPVKLNYLDVNIPFSHVTYQHHNLAPAGQPGDRTIMYVVNDRPLSETLVPWTYYSDLAAATSKKEK